jgi:hypothetical protein
MTAKLVVDFEYFSLLASTVDGFTGLGAIRVNWAPCGRGFVVAVSALLVFGGCASTVGPIFVGGFQTGNFNQWPWCQNVAVGSVPCSSFRTSTHSMQVVTNVVRPGSKFAARFEVRHGDQPKGICCGDRAEVSGEAPTEANEGDDLWYQWSTLFDENFPAGPEWSVVSQWHANQQGSPPVAIALVGADRWGIVLATWNAPGDRGPTFTPWSAPVIRGVWNDIKLHIKWSVHDDVGFIELWHDGVPQTLGEPCAGQTRCMVRTLMPGGDGVYFKQGYDRDPAITATGVVYHSGFSIAHTEADLAPL